MTSREHGAYPTQAIPLIIRGIEPWKTADAEVIRNFSDSVAGTIVGLSSKEQLTEDEASLISRTLRFGIHTVARSIYDGSSRLPGINSPLNGNYELVISKMIDGFGDLAGKYASGNGNEVIKSAISHTSLRPRVDQVAHDPDKMVEMLTQAQQVAYMMGMAEDPNGLTREPIAGLAVQTMALLRILAYEKQGLVMSKEMYHYLTKIAEAHQKVVAPAS